MDTIFWTFQSVAVTLKIRSRSSKSNQHFPSSQHCIYASLVKIHPLVQKITQGNNILDISKCPCDLENKSRSPKSNQLFPFSKQCIFASLVKIHQLVQKIMDKNVKVDAEADRIRTKNNISPTLQDGGT